MTSGDSASKPTLSDLLNEKAGVLSPDDSVQQAGDKMRSLGTDSLPVTEGRQLVGTMTDRDSDRNAAGRGHDPNALLVRESMSRDVVYCYEDQGRAEAERMMIEKGMNYMPVVDREMRIVGVLTRADLEKGDLPVPGLTPCIPETSKSADQ